MTGAFVGAGFNVSESSSNPEVAKTDVVGKVTASADVSAGHVVAGSVEENN